MREFPMGVVSVQDKRASATLQNRSSGSMRPLSLDTHSRPWSRCDAASPSAPRCRRAIWLVDDTGIAKALGPVALGLPLLRRSAGLATTKAGSACGRAAARDSARAPAWLCTDICLRNRPDGGPLRPRLMVQLRRSWACAGILVLRLAVL